MNKLFSKIWNYSKNRLRRIIKVLKNPGLSVADFIYSIYKKDKDKIPYPLYLLILKYYGGWAGIGFYLPKRQYFFNVKVLKLKKVILDGLIPVLAILCITLVTRFAVLQGPNSLFFGFSQNLLSDIVLILLIIYILPKLLNKPKKYNVILIYEYITFHNNEGKQEIMISIVNTGEETYKTREIYWEIFIPYYLSINKDDIFIEIGKFEKYSTIPLTGWKIYGFNEGMLFPEQDIKVFRINISPEVLISESSIGPHKIYYRFFTINGNIPSIEKITRDFIETGITMEMYPKVGELCFKDWYDPDYFEKARG